MKFTRTGRFDKDKGFLGGSDLENVTSQDWPRSKASAIALRMPHQSISVMSERTSDMSPSNPKHAAKMRESYDTRGKRLDTALRASVEGADDEQSKLGLSPYIRD